MGHHVSLLPPAKVSRYRDGNRTDRADAKALLEASRNCDICPVPVKSVEQQVVTALHRLRSQYLATRTARINGVRGLMREFGLVIPLGARNVVPQVRSALAEGVVPAFLRTAMVVRVCLDTNVLVSAFSTRGLSADVLNLILAEHQLVLGETVLTELQRVLTQRFRVPGETVEATLSFLRTQAVVVSPGPALDLSLRDKDDEPVLAGAVAGLAEVLVTGDQDLLEAVDRAPIRIVNPRGFWAEVRADQDGG